MELITFKNNRRLLEEYAGFSRELYLADPNCSPSRVGGFDGPLSFQSKAVEKPGNDFQHFLLRDRGRLIGGVSAFVNRDLFDRDGAPVGTVGYFECIENFEAARVLLDSACGWLVENHGRMRVWGPMNFDIWHGYRFKISGFEEEPFVGEPHNKPYYPEFFRRYGFSVKAGWDSLRVSGRQTISRMIARGEARYRLLLERGYRFEHMTLDRLGVALPDLHKVLRSSFAGFLGYTDISEVEFASLFKSSLSAFDPDLAVLVYDEQSNLAGFAVACVEPGEEVRGQARRHSIWSHLKRNHRRIQPRTANFYLGGVTPAEVARRSGLGRAGFYYVIKKALDKGYDTILLTLRLKGNLAHGLAARSNCAPYCEYALCEWNHE